MWYVIWYVITSLHNVSKWWLHLKILKHNFTILNNSCILAKKIQIWENMVCKNYTAYLTHTIYFFPSWISHPMVDCTVSMCCRYNNVYSILILMNIGHHWSRKAFSLCLEKKSLRSRANRNCLCFSSLFMLWDPPRIFISLVYLCSTLEMNVFISKSYE